MQEIYGFKVKEENWRVREKLEFEVLNKVFNKIELSRSKVLDCGTGVGYAAKYLAKRAKEVLTVDIDPTCLKNLTWLMNDKLPENLVFVRGDLRDLNFIKNCYFDIAVFYYTLHTVESTTPGGLQKVLEEAYRLLKKGGLLVIVENYPSFKPLDKAHEVFLELCKIENEILNTLGVQAQDIEYKPEELAELVTRISFKIEKVIKIDEGSFDPTLTDWISFLRLRAEKIVVRKKRKNILEKLKNTIRKAEKYGVRDAPSYVLYAIRD